MTGADHDVDQYRVLLARTSDAVTQLRDVRCTDPEATAAVRVIRLTEHTLTTLWLPALHEVVDDAT